MTLFESNVVSQLQQFVKIDSCDEGQTVIAWRTIVQIPVDKLYAVIWVKLTLYILTYYIFHFTTAKEIYTWKYWLIYETLAWIISFKFTWNLRNMCKDFYCTRVSCIFNNTFTIKLFVDHQKESVFFFLIFEEEKLPKRKF